MTPIAPTTPAPRPNDAAEPLHPEQAPRRWTHVRVHSNHVAGRFDTGLLRLTFDFERRHRGIAHRDEIWFEAPPDFHTHNDSVAAAVMTLLSTSVGAVTFNFGVSERCADLLRDYYRLTDVRPVDPALEPRRPGRWVGLNFSGGLDSFAVKSLLDDILSGEYKVITTAHRGPYAHEASGYEPHRRDVTCRTNFREKRYTHGRFNSAVPLLFADYLDLESLTTGHTFTQAPPNIESLEDGSPPRFLLQQAAWEAGGLRELHIARGLNQPGMVKAVMHLPAEQLEWAFNGSGSPRSAKYNLRGTILRSLLERSGQPVPPFLHALTFTRTQRLGVGFGGLVQILYVARHAGPAAIRAFSPEIDEVSPAWLDSLVLDFPTKYNPNYIDLLPERVRAPLLATLSRRGIEPYSERDWWELGAVREFWQTLQESR